MDSTNQSSPFNGQAANNAYTKLPDNNQDATGGRKRSNTLEKMVHRIKSFSKSTPTASENLGYAQRWKEYRQSPLVDGSIKRGEMTLEEAQAKFAKGWNEQQAWEKSRSK